MEDNIPAFSAQEPDPFFIIINGHTGEVLEEYHKDICVKAASKSSSSQHNRSHFTQKKKEEKKIIEETGGYKQRQVPENRNTFFWYIYDPEDPFISSFTEGEIYRMFRAMYNLSYGGYLAFGNGRAITLEHLSMIWGDSQQVATKHFKSLISKGVFKIFEGKIYVNQKMFFRGRIKSKVGQDMLKGGKSAIRIYDEALRNVGTTRTRKSCGMKYLFELIPCLNKQYNVTCREVYATDPDLMEPLRKTNIAKFVGLDSTAANTVIDAMSGLYIQGYHYKEPVILFETCETLGVKYPSIIVNPRLFYAGNIKEHTNILEIFDRNRIYDEEIKE